MYESVTRNIHVVVRPKYLAEPVAARRMTISSGPIRSPSPTRAVEIVTLRSRSLEDHRRPGQAAGSAGRRRGRRATDPGARRKLRIYLRRSAYDAIGLHGRRPIRWRPPSGERFDVDIPAFSLDSPQSHRTDQLTAMTATALHAARHAGPPRRLRHHEPRRQPSAHRIRRSLSRRLGHSEPAGRLRSRARRPISMPRSARILRAASCSRAIPTSCRSTARTGRPIPSRSSRRTASSMAAAPAT